MRQWHHYRAYINYALKSPWVLLAAVVIHAVGYLACLREPRMFELWLVKAARCPRIPNYRRWHCNSYHP